MSFILHSRRPQPLPFPFKSSSLRRFTQTAIAAVIITSMIGCSTAPPAAPTTPPTTATSAPTAAAPTPAATIAPAQATTAPSANPTVKPQEGLAPATGSPTAAAASKGSEGLKPAGVDLTPTKSPQRTALERTVVDALWVSVSNQVAKGGTSSVKVNVERNDNRELRVGFYEEEVGGSGPMWRAAGWMAVIMSSFLLGIDPVEYRYTYDVGGQIDGPSAGALMTIATMSSLLGHKVKAEATMTGTINPDGTIGPVGGIPHKIDGASAKGKTLILVPAGSRMSIDQNTKQQVDVIDRGRRLNVTVREVSDIYEAYELMTGQPLPKPTGLKDVRPELPATAFERSKGKTKEWFTRYWQLQSQYDSLPAAYRYDFTDAYMQESRSAGDRSDKYFQQGLASAAYSQAITATLYSSLAFHTSKVLEAYGNNDSTPAAGVNAALSYMKSLQTVNLKIDAQLDRLQTQKPNTLSDALALSDAYGSINLAMALSGLADNTLQKPVQTEEQAVAVLAMATLYYAIADHEVELAKDAIDLGWGFGTAPAPTEERATSMAELFRRAAEANLNYFDAIVLNEIASGAGVSVDVVKSSFASQDFNYTFAITSLRNLPTLKNRAGPGSAGIYATFGGALNSYVLSSGLIAKYYSLGAQIDKEGNLTGLKNERALINMLDFSEKRAREMVGLANSLGADPVHPIIYYEQGKVNREGNLESKLEALTNYWQSILQSQALAVMSGKANVTIK